MVITQNKVTVDSNVIIVTTIPVVGIIALTGFADTLIGLDSDHTVDRFFQYSTDGVNYSESSPLTVSNIESLSLEATDILVFKIIYNKSQPLGSTNIVFDSLEITSNQELPPSIEAFDKSYFSTYFSYFDSKLLEWTINMLEKLHYDQLIPKYINTKSESFIEYWHSVIRFFGFYVRYAQMYDDALENIVFIQSYLKQTDIQLGIESEYFEYLMTHINSEYGKRGTVGILENTEDNLLGELLRLINFSRTNEFIYGFSSYISWIIDNTSPLYRGTDSRFNKMWERGSITDLNKYYTSGNTSLVTINNKTYININNGSIGTRANVVPIPISDKLNYSFTFKVKFINEAKVTVSFIVLDENDDVLSFIPYNNSPLTTYHPIDEASFDDNSDVLFRVAIYNSQQSPLLDAKSQIPGAYDIILPTHAAKIIPQITIEGIAQVSDILLIPLYTTYSKGFLDTTNILELWIINNNNDMKYSDIIEYIRRYLIPYNTHLLDTKIGQYISLNGTVPVRETYWDIDKAFCETVRWIPTDPSCELTEYIWEPDLTTAYCENI